MLWFTPFFVFLLHFSFLRLCILSMSSFSLINEMFVAYSRKNVHLGRSLDFKLGVCSLDDDFVLSCILFLFSKKKTNLCILIDVQLFFLHRYKTLVYLKYCFSGLAFPPGISEPVVGLVFHVPQYTPKINNIFCSSFQ